jgi:hypothetical protein
VVERLLPKQDVAGSNPVSRSSKQHTWRRTQVAKGAVCKTVIQGSDSPRRLQNLSVKWPFGRDSGGLFVAFANILLTSIARYSVRGVG